MSSDSAFFKTSLKAAERFLQTALVIDDRAFRRSETYEPKPESLEPPPTPSTIQASAELLFPTEPAEDQSHSPAVMLPDPDPHGIDAEAVIKSFAARGIVCSVLQRVPGENPADVGTSGERLLVPADILVIDWQVHGENGSDSNEETLNFLAALVDESARDEAGQLRLVIVYTGAQDLLKVAEKIEERLSGAERPKLQKDGPYAFRVGAGRIVVLGKYSRLRSLESKAQQVDTDEHLAERAIREFATMTSGLVSNVVLDGLAQIRLVTHRILARFGPELDAPFLAHRALLSPPVDGNDHLLPLIASEIEAILEERLNRELLSDETIGHWLDTQADPKPMLTGIPNLRTTEEARRVVRDICLMGVSRHREFSMPSEPAWVKKLSEGKGASEIQKLTELIAARQVDNANERLEELMSLKPRYSTQAPALTLGTLLSQLENGETLYWLCLQPACDCFIRGSETRRAFPLLRLKTSDPQFNLLAYYNGAYVRLKWEARAHRIRMFEFESNSPTRAVVSRPTGTGFRLSTAGGTIEFQWIGELKFAQAQRIAQSMAAESARVGLTESEWLRRNGR